MTNMLTKMLWGREISLHIGNYAAWNASQLSALDYEYRDFSVAPVDMK